MGAVVNPRYHPSPLDGDGEEESQEDGGAEEGGGRQAGPGDEEEHGLTERNVQVTNCTPPPPAS